MLILGLKNDSKAGKKEEIFHYPTSKNALIIFTRNPELGKCKTRLAATVGDKAALDIYTFLLQHTVAITAPLAADKFVYYSVKLHEKDCWNETIFRKKVQHGDDLGIRMEHAFREVFEMGYERAIIIGSDMYDMKTDDIQQAFSKLVANDVVLGPAEDGGYYLMGMKEVIPEVFRNKIWGTNTVLKETLKDITSKKVALLEEKNDVDYYEDIADKEVFQQFFPQALKTK